METKNKEKICEKCKEKKALVANRSKGFCKECFILHVNHKFRANIRKESDITPQDNVLVCISGSNSSMAMIDMLNRFLVDKKTKLKLTYKIKVLYIDDSYILPIKEEEINIEKQKRKNIIENEINQRYSLLIYLFL